MGIRQPSNDDGVAGSGIGRRAVLGVGLAATAAGLSGAPAAAGPAPLRSARTTPLVPTRIPLPAPTGPHRIGTTALHLVDRARPDPWVDTVPYRELMISVWYPARPGARRPAPYMTSGAAAHFDQGLARQVPRYQVGVLDWSGTPTHAGIDAPVSGDPGRHPVVLYGPGGGNPRTLGTGLVGELASHGYVVVTIDHTYEASEVEFPGGRVALDRRPADATRGDSTAVRVADIRFVLDILPEVAAGRTPDLRGRPLPAGMRGSFDLGRIGMFGYSAGGLATAEAMRSDRRIRAGLNLDGKLLADDDPLLLARVAETGLDRPFLQFATPGQTRESDPSWAAFWAHQRGWRRELRLAGATHLGLSDLQVAIPRIGRVMGLTDEEVALAVGDIDPLRSVAIQRSYLTAFFDRHLRGRPGRLLDGPSPSFPEVTFVP